MDFPANPVVLVVCPLTKVSDGSTLRKKGVSATVVGTNSEANSLIRRGMCSLVYGSRYCTVGLMDGHTLPCARTSLLWL